MESFHQYLQSKSIYQNWEKKPINFGVITIQELQPDDFEQIIDLRSIEDFEEDNITSSLNVPMLSRSDGNNGEKRGGKFHHIPGLVRVTDRN